MRIAVVIAVLISTALVPQAGADQLSNFADATGDDGIWGGASVASDLGMDPSLGALGDCRSPAADIHDLTLYSDGETLWLMLRVEELTLDVTCSIVTSSDTATGAEYEVELRRVEEEATGVAAVYTLARTTGFGLVSCVGIAFFDGTTACRAVEPLTPWDATIGWTIPLVGVVPVEIEADLTQSEPRFEDRAYDLRGLDFAPSGATFVTLDAPFGVVAIRDFLTPTDQAFTP